MFQIPCRNETLEFWREGSPAAQRNDEEWKIRLRYRQASADLADGILNSFSVSFAVSLYLYIYAPPPLPPPEGYRAVTPNPTDGLCALSTTTTTILYYYPTDTVTYSYWLHNT